MERPMIRRYNKDIFNKLKNVKNYIILWTSGLKLENKTFENCDFICVTGEKTQFINCLFLNCKVLFVNFNGSIFKNCKFINCKFKWVDFTQAKFYECSFHNCKLSNILIKGSNISVSEMKNTEIKNDFKDKQELIEKCDKEELEKDVNEISNVVPNEVFMELIRILKRDYFDEGGGGKNILYSKF